MDRAYICIVEKILEIYGAAMKKKPKNDELLSHLFMAYICENLRLQEAITNYTNIAQSGP